MADEKTYNQGKDVPTTHTGVPTKEVKPDPKTTVGPAMGKTPREVLLKERELHPVIGVAAHLAGDIDVPFTELSKDLPKLTAVEEERNKQKAELAKKISESLAKYGGNESSVPPNDEYWSNVAKMRALNNP